MVQQEDLEIEPLAEILRGGKPCRLAWGSANEHYLLRGARQGDEGLVRSALRQRADPNVMDPEEGCSALLLACKSGSLGAVQLLCRDGADVHAVDPRGVSALRHSLLAKRPLIAAYLIEHSRGDAIADQREWSDVLQLLVCQCPPPPQKHAAIWGHEDSHEREQSFYACTRLCKMLLESFGAVTGFKKEAIRQGLWQCIYRGNEGAVSVLLSAKVDPSLPDKDDGRTALDLADALGETAIADELVRCGAQSGPEKDLPEWALCLAAARGDVKVARQWLADVKNPNWRHKSMWEDFTPLMYAAGEGSVEIVELLLDLKANAAMADKKGRTPVRLARERGHKRLLPPAYIMLEQRTHADQSWVPDEKDEYVAAPEPVDVFDEPAPVKKPDEKPVKGKIVVNVIRCTGLYDADTLGFGNLSDPYVHLMVVKSKGPSTMSKQGQDTRDLVAKTEVINDSLNPEFNQKFTFGPINLKEDEIRINVFDEDPFTGKETDSMFRDQFLGKLTIPLKQKLDLLSGGEEWKVNQKLKSQPADHEDGKIELTIKFTPQGAGETKRGAARQKNNAYSKSASPATSSGTSTPAKAPAPKKKTQHSDAF